MNEEVLKQVVWREVQKSLGVWHHPPALWGKCTEVCDNIKKALKRDVPGSQTYFPEVEVIIYHGEWLQLELVCPQFKARFASEPSKTLNYRHNWCSIIWPDKEVNIDPTYAQFTGDLVSRGADMPPDWYEAIQASYDNHRKSVFYKQAGPISAETSGYVYPDGTPLPAQTRLELDLKINIQTELTAAQYEQHLLQQQIQQQQQQIQRQRMWLSAGTAVVVLFVSVVIMRAKR
jgi:hypothetical protein